jgi:hypothetical protein
MSKQRESIHWYLACVFIQGYYWGDLSPTTLHDFQSDVFVILHKVRVLLQDFRDYFGMVGQVSCI